MDTNKGPSAEESPALLEIKKSINKKICRITKIQFLLQREEEALRTLFAEENSLLKTDTHEEKS